MVARCLVLRTGTFLNMVASSNFIESSFNGFATATIEQPRCQTPDCPVSSKKCLSFEVLEIVWRRPVEGEMAISGQLCTVLVSFVQEDSLTVLESRRSYLALFERPCVNEEADWFGQRPN